ncbi:restriction endonuclease subunit S [Mycoplasmopsis felis]|uniref:restriction endonuclease subunit S n=1 Tax=Mycoplasmopsis felis TaxID=33923 RepID=UPI002AFE676A|nr:restriction endonuclease subunit S [Mycoplasmopsis felis]WQQ10766.1 restriction endonuclease subunit S [Mycoplasmopsis felis]
MKKVLVPRVRFKGFGEEWSEERIENLSSFRRGSFPQPYGKEEWYNGVNLMPFVQVFDIGDDLKLEPKTKQKISLSAQRISVFVKKGSVLVSLQGTIGRTAVSQYDSYIDRTILVFEGYKTKINKTFWAHIIKKKFQIESDNAPGAIIKTITKEVLSNFQLLLPKYNEQQKIGKLLDQISNLITLEEIKHNKLKQLKETLLQKMFPEYNSKYPRIRFKGFDEEWKEEKLDDIFKVITGGEPPKNYKNSKHPVGKYKYPIYSNGQEANAIWGFSDNYSINTEAITISSIGTIGFPVVRKMFFTPIIRLKTLLPYNKNMNINFLNLSVSQINFSFNQAGIPSMNSNQLKDNIILISRNFSEQQKIGDFFSKIDTLLDLYNSKLKKLKQIKEALLQKMFV